PLAVHRLELCSRRLAPLENVEHVAEHFEHRTIVRGLHRGGARIRAHAGHFAEVVPGGKGGNWVVVVEGNWGVDMDKPGTALFVAIVLVAILQAADEAANEAERPPVNAIALSFPPLHMLDRRLD